MKQVEVRVVGRYRFLSQIEGNHDSLLFRAQHTQTNEHLFVKGEETKSGRNRLNCLTLLQEGKILQSMQGGFGVPRMAWCGMDDEYNFLVLEQLGQDMRSMLRECGGTFTLKTTLMIGLEVLNMLQYCHFKNYVFNCLCPQNLMRGKGSKLDQLYLVDYGKVSRYCTESQQHIDENRKERDPRTNNLLFSSLNYQKGSNSSRRDDMASLMYLLAYFLRGDLPWTERLPQKQILELKQQGGLFSEKELNRLLKYTLEMDFREKPQYTYYQRVFTQLLEEEINDGVYDWVLLDEPDQEGQMQDQVEDIHIELPIEPKIQRKLKAEKECIIC